MAVKETNMTKQITGTRKNADGDITHLCGRSFLDSKREVRRNIEANNDVYLSGRSRVEVVTDPRVADGFYLRTIADGSTGNNLDQKPNC